MLRHLQFSSLLAEQLERESFAACVWSAKRHAVCREVCRLSMRSGRKGPNGLDRGGGNAGWACALGTSDELPDCRWIRRKRLQPAWIILP